MGGLITAAEAAFASTTGFGIDDVVSWAGDNLIKLFLGSMLAVLYELRIWIVVLLVISIIIFFAYRGLHRKGV